MYLQACGQGQPHLSQNICYAIHSAVAAPKLSFNTADDQKFQESSQPIRSPVQLSGPGLFALKLLPQDHVQIKYSKKL